MENFTTTNTARRYKAHVSLLGTTQIHLRNPHVIAWWSAAFPGFGHLLLSKYIRGFVLFIWEVVVNLQAHVNLALMYTFQGNFEMASSVLDTRWLLAYLPVYLFAIFDSHRTTVDLNRIYLLADHENHRFNTFSIGALEINYLDKRNPILAAVWSFFVPGLGQLYIHRVVTATFIIIWAMIFCYFSRVLETIPLLFIGEIQLATSLLNGEWLLMLPSLYGFAIYDAYTNAVENNKLFDKELSDYLREHYQNVNFQHLTEQRGKG